MMPMWCADSWAVAALIALPNANILGLGSTIVLTVKMPESSVEVNIIIKQAYVSFYEFATRPNPVTCLLASVRWRRCLRKVSVYPFLSLSPSLSFLIVLRPSAPEG